MKIAVVIPSYKVTKHVLGVISTIGPEVARIYAVDDCCPEQSGKFIEAQCQDPRVKVLYNEVNRGVGGATITGYKAALQDGFDIAVKVDGDGQMNPKLIPSFVRPILEGTADYSKGNRFFDLESLSAMPSIRLFGNACLSFVSKLVSGYWNIMDPTNGFTAIHRGALSLLPLDKLDNRYFFESDLLFRLNTIRAVVTDIPMSSHYADEESNLRVSKVLLKFPRLYIQRFFKRIFYNYILRDFTPASLELLFGISLFAFGTVFGLYSWYIGSMTGVPATTGTVMIAALPIIIGFQLLLAALSYDMNNLPKDPLQKHF